MEDENKFVMKHEIKTMKSLSKIFAEAKEEYSEDEILAKEDLFLMDASNVIGVLAKTKRAKLLLKRFVDKNISLPKLPTINYNVVNGVAKSRFNSEYLIKCLQVLEAHFESVTITTAEDYPIRIENNDFCFYLACRVNNEVY